MPELNLYTEYKRGFPRLKSTGWSLSPCTVTIFPDSFWSLEPLEKSSVDTKEITENIWFSRQLLDICDRSYITTFPFPRLAPFIKGLARRYLDSEDPTAMIAAEQLVDGTDLDMDWSAKHLGADAQEVKALIERLIFDKQQRIDDFSENTITCYVLDQEEAQNIRRIPGYE